MTRWIKQRVQPVYVDYNLQESVVGFRIKTKFRNINALLINLFLSGYKRAQNFDKDSCPLEKSLSG